jgi:hypothetical protein
MKKITLALAIAIAINSIIPQLAVAADARRQAEVAERGKDVMPFSMEATTHIFTKTAEGGTQRVVVKNIADADQTKSVRVHLLEIKQQFMTGDFSAPSHIHGKNMPGLDELRSAKQAELAVNYRDVVGGAELAYRTSNPVIVAALHKWFDAQLSDHGTDAMEGHQHHHGVAEQ